MTVASLLETLRSRDVQLWTEGDQLRCSAPGGVLTAELREQLRDRKEEILDFLRSAAALSRQERAIVPLQPSGGRIPIFAVPGHNGNVFAYRALAQRLGKDQPFFGLEPPGADGQGEPLTRVEDLAAYFADQIRAVRPGGPCVIAGFCAGGSIAFELARQLQAGGTTVTFLAMFTSPHPTSYRFFPELRQKVANQVARGSQFARLLASSSNRERWQYLAERIRCRVNPDDDVPAAEPETLLAIRIRMQDATRLAVRNYNPQPFAGRVVLFLPSRQGLRPGSALLRWRALARETEEYCGPDGCIGTEMLQEPHVGVFAEFFRRCCDRAESDQSGAELRSPSGRIPAPV